MMSVVHCPESDNNLNLLNYKVEYSKLYRNDHRMSVVQRPESDNNLNLLNYKVEYSKLYRNGHWMVFYQSCSKIAIPCKMATKRNHHHMSHDNSFPTMWHFDKC